MGIFYLIILIAFSFSEAILYPQESTSRELKDLSGRWKFAIDDSTSRNESFQHSWWLKPLADSSNTIIDMPVPASYNDITQEKKIRDFIGWVWYETNFRTYKSWNNKDTRIWLRVGSAHYHSKVWVNGKEVMEHKGGHLPFESDITDQVYKNSSTNRLTISINNTLTTNTLPPGSVQHYNQPYPKDFFTMNYQFDFFNYAGIHRPVVIYTTPTCFIESIQTSSSIISENLASLQYEVLLSGACSDVTVNVKLKDKNEKTISKQNDLRSGSIEIENPNFWWPVGMNKSVGYLYTLVVTTSTPDNNEFRQDAYNLRVGIRTVEVLGTRFLINKKPFYFLGVGKHEDWIIRGKGFDWSSVIKDFNLLEWLGANSFRTSHYPYSEEIMRMCDERGIVVIDESPAVGMKNIKNFANKTLQHHLKVMKELISRDQNHPSVVMWSVANEPKSDDEITSNYFKTVLDYTRKLDTTRPATFVCNRDSSKDKSSRHVDVIAVNNYEAWYNDYGFSELIVAKVTDYLNRWHKKLNKPIIFTEYGAGAIAGFHSSPPVMYSEDYESSILEEHFKVFDLMRCSYNPYLAGSMIWNFADFATKQESGRAFGNRKGLFTRDRQPKSAAHLVRRQYWQWRNQSSWCKTDSMKLHFNSATDGTVN